MAQAPVTKKRWQGTTRNQLEAAFNALGRVLSRNADQAKIGQTLLPYQDAQTVAAAQTALGNALAATIVVPTS